MLPDLKEHALLLGKILGNLQTLEFSLRVSLHRKEPKPSRDLLALKVGDVVDANYLTDYSSLIDLIEDYNNKIANNNPIFSINCGIVDLRDALAHGRILAPESGFLQIVKFSKKDKNSKVEVVFAEQITPGWLKSQIKKVHDEILKIINFNKNIFKAN
jgi:hypothetical protein